MATEQKRMRQLRHTAATWSSNNPILLDGELGIETDSSRMKAGDGITFWNSLPYLTTHGADGAAGNDAFQVQLTNPTVSVPADWDGSNPALSSAKTIAKLFQGATEISAASLTISVPDADGATVSINQTTNQVSVTAMPNDSHLITIRVTYAGDVWNVGWSVVKTRNGYQPFNGFLTNEAHTVPANADGTGYPVDGFGVLPQAGGTFHVFSGDDDVTASALYTLVNGVDNGTDWSELRNGLTLRINETGGVYQLEGLADSWISDEETFEIQADYGTFSIVRKYTISKSRSGGTAPLLRISASGQTFKYDPDGTLVAPTEIDFTADQQGDLGVVSWKTQYWDGDSWEDTVPNYVDAPPASADPAEGLTAQLLESEFAASGENSLRVYAEFTHTGTLAVYWDAMTIISVQDGATGIGRTVMLTSNDYSIDYTSGSPVPATVDLTATPGDISGITPFYKWYKDDVAQSGNGATRVGEAMPGTKFGNQNWKVELYDTIDTNPVLAVDSISLFGIADGADGSKPVVIIVQNQAHAIHFDEAGVGDYADSGTDIEVYVGGTQALIRATGGLSPNEYRIVGPLTDVNITAGAISQTTGQAVASIGNHSAWSGPATIAYVDIDILVQDDQGNENTYTYRQTLTKVSDGPSGAIGRTMSVTCTDYTIDYTTGSPLPANVTLTATPNDGTGITPFYQWYLNGSGTPDAETSDTLLDNGIPGTKFLNRTWKVDLHDTNAGNPVLATDSLTIHGIEDGVDGEEAITVVMRNATHAIANENYSGSGTDIEVWVGATRALVDLTPDGDDFYIFSATGNNITAGGITNTPGADKATVGDHSNQTNPSAYVDIVVRVANSLGAIQDITVRQTLSPVTDGAGGDPARTVTITANDYSIDYTSGSPVPSTVDLDAIPGDVTGITPYYKWYKNGTPQLGNTASRTENMPGTKFGNENWKVELYDTNDAGPVLGEDTLSLYGVIDGAPGEDAITVIMHNPAHSIPFTTAGVGDYANSGTRIEVLVGATTSLVETGTLGANEFKISTVTGSNIVGGAKSQTNGNAYADVLDHSGWVDDQVKTAYVDIIVQGKDDLGTFFSITVRQTHSRLDENEGPEGPTSPRTHTGYVYYQLSSASAPAAPTNANSAYNLDTGVFDTLPANWSLDAPTFDAGNTNKYWYSRFQATEDVFEGTVTETFTASMQGIGFTGLVTFTSTGDPVEISDGQGGVISLGDGGTTTIDGGVIISNTILAESIVVSDLFAQTMQVNNDGYIRVGTNPGAHAQIGPIGSGGNALYFSAVDSSGRSVFQISDDDSSINGEWLSLNSIGPGVLTQEAIDQILGAGGTAPPSTGGTRTASAVIPADPTTANMDTNSNSVDLSVSSPGQVKVFSLADTSRSAPQVTVNVQRRVDGGVWTTITNGTGDDMTNRTFTGSAHRGDFLGPNYEWTLTLPSFNLSQTLTEAATSDKVNVQWRAVITFSNWSGTADAQTTISAIQGGSGAAVGGIVDDVVAGTGMTGGGSADTVTLNVIGANGIIANANNIEPDYGAAVNTVCQGNDSRLADSREWTASTVTQVEAEAGTATTRRAWTAQRVKQAIDALGGAGGYVQGDVILADYGTQALPGYAFDGDANSGLFRSAVDVPAMSAGNNLVQEWWTTFTTIHKELRIQDGTVGSPGICFANDQNSGIWRASADTMHLVVAGASAIEINIDDIIFAERLRIPNGSLADPAIHFANSTGTGIYRVGADILGIGVAGVSKIQMAATYIRFIEDLQIRAGNDLILYNGGNTASVALAYGTGPSGLDIDGVDVTELPANVIANPSSQTITSSFINSFVYWTGASTQSITLNNASGWAPGHTVQFHNLGSTTRTLQDGDQTVYLMTGGGTPTDVAVVNLGPGAVCTATYMATNTWHISGNLAVT